MRLKSAYIHMAAVVRRQFNIHMPDRARYWLATVDFPIVRTTLTWHITAPQRFTSLANGASVGEEVKDGFKTTHWKLDHRW